MLQIHSLSYAINQKPLFKALDFRLKEGENLIILGANGSGKSTLAKMLCGLISCSRKVQLGDEYIEELTGKKRAKRINYMPSKFSLYDPYVTVTEYLNLSLYKHTPKEDNIKEILSSVQLLHYHDTYAGELSSGEQQLLLLASSMMQDSDITIFDEPTSNLDPKKTKLVFDILQKGDAFKQKIVITHDLQFAFKLGYPILYLEEGQTSYFKEDFFTTSNLQKYFNDTIMIVDNHIVEAL